MMKKITLFLTLTLVLLFIPFVRVNALQYYVNGSQLSGSSKYYTDGNVNISTQIRDTNSDFPLFLDLSVVPQYGYIAICSALGNNNNRYINSAFGSNITDINIVNSTVGCTIPTTNAYVNSARVVYFTFTINTTFWDCSAQGTSCVWPNNGNLGLTFYQPNSNEYSLVSFGYSDSEPFNFNDSVDPKVRLQEQQNQLQQEQNTLINQQIENDKVCNVYDIQSIKTQNHFINGAGNEISNTYYGITNYININGATINVLESISGTSAPSMCFYNVNKSLLSCLNYTNISQNQNISIPSGSSYVRFSINTDLNKPQFKVCKNGNQAQNDLLSDDDVDESTNTGADFFNSFTTNNHGLTGIVSAPLILIESLTSKTCSPLVLPLPFVNQNLELPCMTAIYSQYFGNFYNMYKVITFGIVSYWVLVRIFALVKDFKNPEHDEIEVMDL